MLVLQFETEALWRACCHSAEMRRRWGDDLARRISLRLQQLEAMTSLADLDFMPFDVTEDADGIIEIALDDEMSLFLREAPPAQEDGHMPQTTLMVSAVSTQTMAAP